MDHVYVVMRESADGMETDIFTDYDLATRWALLVGCGVSEETVIDEETLKAMEESYREEPT